MASIAREPNGHRRILFVAADGARKTIRLGKVSQRTADAVRVRVEHLLAAVLTGHALDGDTARWVADLKGPLADKLARVGLIQPRQAEAVVTLGEHLTAYFSRRTDVKPNTLGPWRHAERDLLAYFGAERALASITPGEAKDWERWLRTGAARKKRSAEYGDDEGMAPTTVRKRINDAKQFFGDAVERQLMARNPFAKLSGTIGNNRARDHFITRDVAGKVLGACPDAQWRLLFALSRYGGLRCPSEHLALTWGDVNWAESRMLVRSSKTERHEGKGTRLVPIFPELRPYLEAVRDQAEPGSEHVITRYRSANANLRTQLERIIRQAGLVPWPKLFQNLRASRATELAAEFPAHVAAAWLGHSTLVASKHYWQVTDADFARAVGGGAESGAPAAQNPAQRTNAENRAESQPLAESVARQPFMPVDALGCVNPPMAVPSSG